MPGYKALLEQLYIKYPGFKAGRRQSFFYCVALTAALITALYLIALVATLIGFSWLSTHPGWLGWLSIMPGFLVMLDTKASLIEMIGYVLLSWLVIVLVGALYAMLMFFMQGM
jgi:hypothetical protein